MARSRSRGRSSSADIIDPDLISRSDRMLARSNIERMRRRNLRDDYSSESILGLEDQDYRTEYANSLLLGYDNPDDMRKAKSDNFGKVVGISLAGLLFAGLSIRNYQQGLGLNPVAGFFK